MKNNRYLKVFSCVQSLVVLLATIVPMLIYKSVAAEIQNSSIESPFSYKKYHVHYDINADGTYTESDELMMTVLTESGVQKSKQKPFGIDNSGLVIPSKRSVEILSAYTLKNNGRQINAIHLNSSEVMGEASRNPNLSQVKFVSFKDVEIGDILVVSYKAIQQAPAIPNNVVINHVFPKFIAYEDANISLSAPISLKLRFDLNNIEKGEYKVVGNIQQMVWKYQNNNAEVVVQPGQLPSTTWSRIHISSFKDFSTEMEVVSKMTNTSAPLAVAPTIPYHPHLPNYMTCNAQGNIQNDGPEALERVEDLVKLYFWHDENLLNEAANEWNNSSCVFDDGRPMLTALKDAFSKNFKEFNTQPDWSQIASRLDELNKKFPDTAFVAIAEAVYWTEYAWNARGSGYASSVTPDGWKLFRERLEKAEKILLDTKPYSAQLPIWYDQMILVQSALDGPEDERDKTFLEGTRKFKTYYPTYFTMLNFLSPKWGGTWETVDNMVKWSVENTKEIDGNTMYARLYWSASGGLPKDVKLFKDTLASWPNMKSGFEDLMAKHPKSKWNLNNFAKFACIAEDKNTFLVLRRRIGKDVMVAAWSQYPSLDLCEAKFGYMQ